MMLGLLLSNIIILTFTCAATVAGEDSFTVSTDAEVNAMEGDTVLLSCYYDCVIPPGTKHTVVQWWRLRPGNEERILLKNGGEISSSTIQWAGNVSACNASIVMHEVWVKDSAKYRCEVVHLPSYTEGHSVVELHVSHPKDLPVYAPTETTVIVGNDIILDCSYSCKAHKDSYTLVEWWRLKDDTEKKIVMKNGEPSAFEPRMEWRGDKTSCNASISIARVQPEDAARYRCEVTYLPSYRQGRRVTRLDVRPQPDLPIQTTTTITTVPVEDKDTHTTVITVTLVLVGLIVFFIITCVLLRILRGRFLEWIPLTRQWRERRRNVPAGDAAAQIPRNGDTAAQIPLNGATQGVGAARQAATFWQPRRKTSLGASLPSNRTRGKVWTACGTHAEIASLVIA